MRIFAAGDMHGIEERFQKAIYAIKEHSPDIIVLAGDITTFGPAKVASDFLKSLPMKAVTVPGNCDTPDVISLLKSESICVHNKRAELKEMWFAGFGGTRINPPPYTTPVEFSEGEIFNSLLKIMDEKTVLVTHSPPEGTLDSPDGFRHIGSSSVLHIIEKFKPSLVICAHVHESPGIEKRGRTTIVNCTMAEGNSGALIELDGESVTAEII